MRERPAIGRRRRAPRVAAAAILMAVVGAAPAALIDEVAERYARDGGVGGRFEQRLVAPGGRERVYTGRYHYSKDNGLQWEVTSPSQGELVIDREGDARVSGELGGLSIFQKRTVGRLIVAMVALDETILERYYRIEEDAGVKGFEITLEALPRWRKLAGTVTIEGAKLVESVRMVLPDGRTMKLTLTHDADGR